MARRVPLFRLVAQPLTDEAERVAGFAWADPDIGTRHQLGGEPLGRAVHDFPRCSSCNALMSFYGQLDSIGDDIVIADAGVIHVFLCFDCFEAVATVWST